MGISRGVILVQQSAAATTQYALQLPDHSFPTRVCSSVNSFRQLHQASTALAGVIVGTGPRIGPLVAGLRKLDARLWIVCVQPGSSEQTRVECLLRGADICLNTAVSARELAGLLHSAWRRVTRDAQAAARAQPDAQDDEDVTADLVTHDVGQALSAVTDALARPSGCRSPASPGSAACWSLIHGGRALRSPQGTEVPLTPSERIFMARLFHLRDRPVHRTHMAEIGESTQDQDEEDARQVRNIDVLVSRLRSKAARFGADLPIKAVRGWGYLFAPSEGPVSSRAQSADRDAPVSPVSPG